MTRKRITWTLILLYTLFIFSNSMMNGEISSHQSGIFSSMLMSLLTRLNIAFREETIHFVIRKGAHFAEYFLLGIFVLRAHRRVPLTRYDVYLFMAVPFLDEGIQHFTEGRFGALSDCLLDLSGYCAGALLVYLLTRKNIRNA